ASREEYQTTALVGLGIGHIIGMTIAAGGMLWAISRLITHRRRMTQTRLTATTAAGGSSAGAAAPRWGVSPILGASPGPVATIGAALLGGIVAVTIVAVPTVALDRSLLRALNRRHAAPISNVEE